MREGDTHFRRGEHPSIGGSDSEEADAREASQFDPRALFQTMVIAEGLAQKQGFETGRNAAKRIIEEEEIKLGRSLTDDEKSDLKQQASGELLKGALADFLKNL